MKIRTTQILDKSDSSECDTAAKSETKLDARFDGFLAHCSSRVYEAGEGFIGTLTHEIMFDDRAYELLAHVPKSDNFKESETRLFVNKNFKAVAFRFSTYIVLVFEGTNPGELADWLIDIKFLLPRGKPKRHRGFQKAWEALAPEIWDWCRAQGDHDGLLISGHSLGGAMAILAASHLCTEIPIAGVVTFAAPRVGVPAFRAHYDDDLSLGPITRQYRLPGDGVTKIPPEAMYEHVGIGLSIPLLKIREKKSIAGIEMVVETDEAVTKYEWETRPKMMEWKGPAVAAAEGIVPRFALLIRALPTLIHYTYHFIFTLKAHPSENYVFFFRHKNNFARPQTDQEMMAEIHRVE